MQGVDVDKDCDVEKTYWEIFGERGVEKIERWMFLLRLFCFRNITELCIVYLSIIAR